MKKDIEKNTDKQVVFIESDLKLDSAIAFSQYVFQSKRLITIIGEYHTNTWVCPPPNITIGQYCRKTLTANPECKILLEYNSKFDPTKISSHGIKSVWETLQNMNRTDAVIPCDFRSFFLTKMGQQDLHTSEFHKYCSSFDKIATAFIEPFFKTIREYGNIFQVGDQYEPSIRNYLEVVYFNDLVDNFRSIAAVFVDIPIDKMPIKDLQMSLIHAWKKVADFFILSIILKNDDISEYIIVIGEQHHCNISKILQTAAVELNHQTGRSSNKCVELYQTLSLSDYLGYIINR